MVCLFRIYFVSVIHKLSQFADPTSYQALNPFESNCRKRGQPSSPSISTQEECRRLLLPRPPRSQRQEEGTALLRLRSSHFRRMEGRPSIPSFSTPGRRDGPPPPLFPCFDPVVASSTRVRLDLDTRKRVWPSAPVYLDFDDRRGHPSFLRFRPWEEDTALHPLSPLFRLHEPLLPLNFDKGAALLHPPPLSHLCGIYSAFSNFTVYIN